MKGEYMDEFGTANHDFWKARVSNPLEKICTNDVQLDRLETDQIIKRLSQNCSVLEAGCGAGVLARDIQSNLSLNRYHGFDFVQDLIEIAKSNFAKCKNRFFRPIQELRPQSPYQSLAWL